MNLNEAVHAPALRTRFFLFFVGAVIVFLLLLLRLWYLQVIKGDQYALLSERNRIRYMPLVAPRGPIYDRNGDLLVDNRPSFDVAVLRQDVEDHEHLINLLSGMIGADTLLLEEKWQEGRRLPAYRPIVLARDIGRDRMDRVLENAVDLPGVLTEVRPTRYYPYTDSASHLFGYLGEITDEELRSREDDGYRSGDFIGKSGLEGMLESHLKGEDGILRLEVDSKGSKLRQLRTLDPLPGKKVFLTLDRHIQSAAESAFGDGVGAAVAIDVHTGEVLAIASRPAFNPELFSRGITGSEWTELLKDPRHPLENRAIKGQYPPGSTFKIVVALSALQAGVVTPATTVDCTGSFEFGNRTFRCWKKKGHGTTDLKKAIKESCDVWFYKAGLDLGIDRLSQTAFALGMGNPLGFEPGGEKPGLIPTREWKRRRFKSPWYDGETVNASIGQGFVLATPLQLAVMTAAVANGGTVYRPHVVKRVEDWEGNVVWEPAPEEINSLEISQRNLSAVRNGLEAVVNESHGTGWAARLDNVKVAGKTGTAQVVRLKDEEEENTKEIPYRFRDHALFVAYAPADDPRIAVAVVVEHGGHGGSAAAPVAKAIFKSYFKLDEDIPGKSTEMSYEGD